MLLVEKRLSKYKRLIKEYDFDEDDDVFNPDLDFNDDEESGSESEDDNDSDGIEDVANNKFDDVITNNPKKKDNIEDKAPQQGVSGQYQHGHYTFNKKGNEFAVDTSDVLSDDFFDDDDDIDYEAILADDDDDDCFKPEIDDDDDVPAPKKKEEKKKKSAPQQKKPVKVDKNKISLEDELMNDPDGVEYTKPTVSVNMFQKAVDKNRVSPAEFRNPYYNELFSKTVPGVHMDKNGRIYISFSFRTPDDIDNDKYGSGVLIRKNTLAEVFTCLYALLNVVDEHYGSIFIGDYADFFDFYSDYILEEDDDEMELMDDIIRKLRDVKITNVYEIKSFIDWYDSKKDEYSVKYFNKEPDKKKVRHSRFKDSRQLFREFDLKKDRMKAGRDARYVDIMTNIVDAMGYDEKKCSDYRPPRKMKSEDLVKLYVAGLILMQKYIPKTPDGLDEVKVFSSFAKNAMKQGVKWEDIVKEYRKY